MRPWQVIVGIFILALLVALGLFRPGWTWFLVWAAAILVGALVWLALQRPAHNREWQDQWLRLPRAEVGEEGVTIEEFRDFRWKGRRDFEARWTERRFSFAALEKVDLVIQPFGSSKLLAHVMLAFDFGTEGTLIVSPEARREKGERYGVLRGAFRHFEMMYVLGGEEDFYTDRAVMRKGTIWAYPIRSTPEFREELLRDLLETVNRLYLRPEFYNSLRWNCTTVLARHLDALRSGPPISDIRLATLLPAKAGKILHRHGWMDTEGTFEEAEKEFRIDEKIRESWEPDDTREGPEP